MDGVAMCQFLYWIENSIGKEKITEITIAEKLYELRSKQDGFVSESFNTIAGYREHGAIVHYSATHDSASEIKPEGFLLVDSGGQYRQGTTDITRTIHLGKPTKEEKIDFTLVLKGMIQISMIQFPYGTRGTQLDILARMAMWNKGINYGHGTGHGVGAFLNVHEGPQSIRPNENPVILEPGMIQSNEPGIYRAGKYGIRIENLIACHKTVDNEFGSFLGFETLTLCPIDTKSVDVKMLLPEELEWLNNYHKYVFEKISPFLTCEGYSWLKEKTKGL
jgi:Xaa-Pro aminopeptidase